MTFFCQEKIGLIVVYLMITINCRRKDYAFPDYKCNYHVQVDNVYHVKISVSDLKGDDFQKAAEKCKNSKQN